MKKLIYAPAVLGIFAWSMTGFTLERSPEQAKQESGVRFAEGASAPGTQASPVAAEPSGDNAADLNLSAPQAMLLDGNEVPAPRAAKPQAPGSDRKGYGKFALLGLGALIGAIFGRGRNRRSPGRVGGGESGTPGRVGGGERGTPRRGGGGERGGGTPGRGGGGEGGTPRRGGGGEA
ncbi:MAG: hypothetical protein AAB339_12135 [Elusimicrobiota bacterium]